MNTNFRLNSFLKSPIIFFSHFQDAIEVSKGKSSLKALNNSLRDLIGMWFNVGFLNLERVTWQSSCDMLQKVSIKKFIILSLACQFHRVYS